MSSRPPPSWQVSIESVPGVAIDDERLEGIKDVLVNLAGSGDELAGPILTAEIPTSTLAVTMTIQADAPEGARAADSRLSNT